MEITVVIVIVSVLVGLAMPNYHLLTVKAIMREGEDILQAVRAAQLRHNLYSGTYTNNINDLDTEFQATQNFEQPIALPNVVGGLVGLVLQRGSVARALLIYTDGRIICGGPDCTKLGY